MPAPTSVIDRIFRILVPEVNKRTLITWTTYPLTIIYLVPLFSVAYLARRPNTYHVRLALLPVTILLAIHGGFGYTWGRQDLDSFNWIAGFLSIACSAKALELACVKEQLKKISEYDAKVNGKSSDSSDASNHDSVFTWLLDALETLTSLRGIGWNFGKDIYIPKETRSTERIPFLKATALQILTSLLILDFASACQAAVPGMNSPEGHSIFYSSLSPLPRYALSTFLHILVSVQSIYGVQMTYDNLTLIGVGLLNQSPKVWPPIFDNPWLSDSLHDFWSRRWHQTQRRGFLVVGGYPGRFLAGEVGFVLGVFLASGLYHESAFYNIGRGWDSRMVLFFVLQGFGILLERTYKRITGKKVGGWPGRVWAYLSILGVGQLFSDSMLVRGIAGGSVNASKTSPTVNFLWPIVNAITGLNLK